MPSAVILRRIVVAATAFATLATLLAVQFTSVHHHYQVHVAKHRILRSLQEMPSLRLHFTVKRSSMRMYGLTEYDVLANPVVTTGDDGAQQVRYNGVATFQENRVTHTYKLVDGVAYYVTKSDLEGFGRESVACLSASSLPPVADILNAINTATHVANVQSEETITCPNGKLLQTTLGGEPYVICTASSGSSSSPSSSNGGFSVYSGDFDVQVSYLSKPVTIRKPVVSEEQAAACEKVPASATVSTSTMSLLGGVSQSFVNEVFVETETTAVLPQATCTCKGAKRPCIFFHGLGQATESGVVDTFNYFGNIKASAPCCSSVKYAVLNTVDNEWFKDSLQQKVCDFSLQQSNTSSVATKTIADTIIVTHSMGNLMLAGAIATGKCSLAPSTSWVGLSGPMKGSMASDYLQNACSGGGGLGGIVANVIGRCPANNATKSMYYETESKASADLKTKYAAAQTAYANSVSAVMCSNDYSGLSSGDQFTYRLLGGSLIPHKSKQNDGVVEYQSCAATIPLTKFAADYNSKFYVTRLNHMDTAFRNGDSTTNNAQKPVKWFECLF